MVVCALAVLAIARQDPSDYKADPVLAKAISVRADAEPVREYIAKIAAATGATLSARPAIGEQRVIAIAADTPAVDVMDRIAIHFNGTWKLDAEQKGYELHQTPKQEQEDAEALKQELLVPLRSWQELAKEQLKTPRSDWASTKKKMADLMAEQMVHLSKYEDEYFGKDPVVRKAWSDKQAKLREDEKSAITQFSPTQRAALEVLAGLTDDQLLQFNYAPYEVYALRPTRMQNPLPSRARAIVNAFVNEYASACESDTTLTKEDKEILEKLGYPRVHPLTKADIVNVRIKFQDNTRFQPFLGFHPGLLIDVVLNQEPWVVTSRIEIPTNQQLRYPPFEQKEMYELLQAPFTPTDSLKAAIQDVEKKAVEDYEAFKLPGGTFFLKRSHARAVNEFAAASGLNLISDCHDAWTRFGKMVPAHPTKQKAIESLHMGSMDWSLDGKWLLFTSQRRALSRAFTIPSANLLTIRDLAATEDTMDNRAQAVSLLGPWQKPRPISLENFGDNELLRFWQALPEDGRKALRSGQSRTGAQLTPTAKHHLYRALMTYGSGSVQYGLQKNFSSAETELKNWLSAFTVPFHYGLRNVDLEITQLMPDGFAADATIYFKSTSHESIWPNLNPPELLPDFANLISAGHPLPKGPVRIGTGERNVLVVVFPQGIAYDFTLDFKTKPTGDPYPTYADIPQPLRDKVNLLIQEMKRDRGG